MSLDQPDPDALPLERYIDTVSTDRIAGWAWYPDAPDEIALIELRDAEGHVAARAHAQVYRADLDSAGKRAGRCSFELRLPSSGPFTVHARPLSGAGREVLLLAEVEGPDPAAIVRFDGQLGVEAGAVGWLDRATPDEIAGWCHWPDHFSKPLRLSLTENGRVLLTTIADIWRDDLVDLRQGNGVCGFTILPPAELFDGAVHRLELRVEDGAALTGRPFDIAFPATPPARPAPVAPAAPVRPPAETPLAFSIIVNFHNMGREAARTLTSLSRRFQRGVEAIAYEVLCIDNGSDEPLDEAFVTSFGPEFRLVRPSVIAKSPCLALNEAARQAGGRWLAVMIDGAHVLSPGVLAEAHAALTATPGALVSLRQWFIGGDQRWFSSVGYSRAQEDVLFGRIDWPNRGYELFNIASPMQESPNSWFDGMSESNCLFVPAALFHEIGGFDETFSIPGAGFANLDLFRRAVDRADALIALIGEASFHQYHGGVTTNIDDAEKDSRVRAYASQYERVRGHGFVNVAPETIKLAGSIRTGFALTGRQKSYCPARLGVTSQIRPRPAEVQFDEEAEQYLQSAYVEIGRHRATQWRGLDVGVAPADLIDIQDALWRAAPDRVVIKAEAAGLAVFVATTLPALGLADARVMWVSPHGTHEILPPGTVSVAIDHGGPGLSDRLAGWIGDAEAVLAIMEPDAGDALPIAAIAAYARLVTLDSYLIVLGAALGQPWLGYSQSWLRRAIQRFVQDHPGFVIDRTMNRHFVSTCPGGFLRRSLDALPVEDYDDALDDLLTI